MPEAETAQADNAATTGNQTEGAADTQETQTDTQTQEQPVDMGFLNGMDDDAEQAESRETDIQDKDDSETDTQEDRPEWLPEKFKSPEDMAKAYANLEKKLGEKQPSAPESYDFDTAIQEHGLAELSDDERTMITDGFKELKMTQDQVNGVIGMYKTQLSSFAAQYGPPVDQEAQAKALRESWGDDLEDRQQAVRSFARTLDRDVLTHPLGKTAKGMELLYSMMKDRRGVEILNSDTAGSADIESRLSEVVADPEYWANTPRGKRLQQEASELSGKLSQVK
ncbi:hypothetical protein [Pacificispira sp.]|uniref:hypothetical protein n=1 Tax=Pacificispira sp. TaxID=2888761 RepID=UPI003BABF474